MCWETIPPRCDRAVVEAANAHKGRMRSGTSASVGEPGRWEPFRFRVLTELRTTFVAERGRLPADKPSRLCRLEELTYVRVMGAKGPGRHCAGLLHIDPSAYTAPTWVTSRDRVARCESGSTRYDHL